MNRVFMLNNKPILNFIDLQREFSPMETYRHLPAFQVFAQVHCIPMPLVLSRTENGESKRYVAVYLKKSFWKDILQRGDWPEAQSAPECLRIFKEEEAQEKINAAEIAEAQKKDVHDNEIRLTVDKEVVDAQIEEKLAFICQSGSLGLDQDDIRKAVMLLAICEIAEMNALKCSFAAEPAESEAADVSETKKQDDIANFPYENNAPLTAGVNPYRFWYHDDDMLTAGSGISTVRVEAKGGANQYETVRIELYSKKTRECVEKIELAEGEYRYCNVSDEEIVKFLPSVSISDSLCLLRKDYSHPDITVLASGSESWVLNMESVSCFSAGTKDTGFLFVQNGKVRNSFFRPTENYMVKLKFDMVTAPVVEVKITQDGYELLTASGTVVSNTASNGNKGIASLDRNSRVPLPVMQNDGDVQEVALSESQKSVAVKAHGGNKHRIIFSGDGTAFEVRQEHGVPTIVY